MELIGKVTRENSDLVELTWEFRKPFQQFLAVIPSGGQPRDSNNFAGYSVLETLPDKRVLKMIRMKYDYKTTQDKVVKAGLPKRLADRLEIGI